jgi:hypothetical protein
VLDGLVPVAHYVGEWYGSTYRGRSWLVDVPPAADVVSKDLAQTHGISDGHAFVQGVRCGHYELGLDLDLRP